MNARADRSNYSGWVGDFGTLREGDTPVFEEDESEDPSGTPTNQVGASTDDLDDIGDFRSVGGGGKWKMSTSEAEVGDDLDAIGSFAVAGAGGVSQEGASLSSDLSGQGIGSTGRAVDRSEASAASAASAVSAFGGGVSGSDGSLAAPWVSPVARTDVAVTDEVEEQPSGP